MRVVTRFDFKESEHPREKDGEFAPEGAGGNSGVDDESEDEPRHISSSEPVDTSKRVFYRGTPMKGEEAFDGDETGTVWFTPEAASAHVYAHNHKGGSPTLTKANLQLNNTLDLWTDLNGTVATGKRKLIEILKEKLPKDSDLRENLDEMRKDPEVVLFDILRDPEVVPVLKKAGYDSVRINDDNGHQVHDSIGVFDKEQIKRYEQSESKSRTGLHNLKIPNHLSFTRFEALGVGQKPGFYPGVLIIETGPAKGHYAVKEDSGRVVNFDAGNPAHAKLQKYPIYIAPETLADVVSCGAGNKSTKCKLDHGSTVRDVVGSYGAFCMDGDQVRADLSLMKSSPHRPYVEELITDFSEKFGNSIDFDYQYEISGDKAIARCVKLNSVDIVDTPAATSSFFSEPNQPNELKHMPLDKADLDAIRGVVTEQLDTRLATLEKGINTRFTKLEEGGEESEEEKKKKKDKEEEDKKTEMSALVAKTVLSAMQSVLPKAQLTSLATPAVSTGGDDTYEGKLALCKSLGIGEGQAIRHIAQKFPALHNAKFGGQVVSAKL